MSKKLLLAVGDCVYSEHAVRYSDRISSAAKDVTYTLFNVQPSVPYIFIEGTEDKRIFRRFNTKKEVIKMPREVRTEGDGTGRGTGRGAGGRRQGGGFRAGPGGECICPSCGEKVVHRPGNPCFEEKCPKCGAAMTRE